MVISIRMLVIDYNPLLLFGFGITIEVNKAHLIIKQKDNIIEVEPHWIASYSFIIDGHFGSISFEAMRGLSKMISS